MDAKSRDAVQIVLILVPSLMTLFAVAVYLVRFYTRLQGFLRYGRPGASLSTSAADLNASQTGATATSLTPAADGRSLSAISDPAALDASGSSSDTVVSSTNYYNFYYNDLFANVQLSHKETRTLLLAHEHAEMTAIKVFYAALRIALSCLFVVSALVCACFVLLRQFSPAADAVQGSSNSSYFIVGATERLPLTSVVAFFSGLIGGLAVLLLAYCYRLFTPLFGIDCAIMANFAFSNHKKRQAPGQAPGANSIRCSADGGFVGATGLPERQSSNGRHLLNSNCVPEPYGSYSDSENISDRVDMLSDEFDSLININTGSNYFDDYNESAINGAPGASRPSCGPGYRQCFRLAFSVASARLIRHNIILAALTVSVFILIAWSTSRIVKFIEENDFTTPEINQRYNNASAMARPSLARQLIPLSTAAGAHGVSFILAFIGGSFSEGLSLSLLQLECETQHRVDGTLRVASGAISSASGLPLALGTLILDIHAVAQLSRRDWVTSDFDNGANDQSKPFPTNSALWLYPLIPAVFTIFSILIPLVALRRGARSPAKLLIRIRLSIILATVLNVGLTFLEHYLHNGAELMPGILSERAGAVYAGVAGLMILLMMTIEHLIGQVVRHCAAYCDVSAEAARGMIASYSDMFAFLALGTLIAVACVLARLGLDLPVSIITLTGISIPALIIFLSISTSRVGAIAAQCYRQTAGMSNASHEVLEALYATCERLDIYSYSFASYTLPLALIGVIGGVLQGGLLRLGALSDKVPPPMPWPAVDSPLLLLLGVTMALFTSSIASGCTGRATCRIHQAVVALVTGDEANASSTHGVGAEEELRGDKFTSRLAVFVIIGGYATMAVVATLSHAMNSLKWLGNEAEGEAPSLDTNSSPKSIRRNAVFYLVLGAAFVVLIDLLRAGVAASIGAAVKRFVTQGGVAYAGRYPQQHSTAVMTAAATTTRLSGCLTNLALWRALVALAIIIATTAHNTLLYQTQCTDEPNSTP